MECQVLSLRRSPRSNNRLMQVEQLEQRWCPTGSKGAPILSFAVTQVNDPGIVISGFVSGANAANSTVTFSGVINQTITTDSTGHFTFTATPHYLGVISAIGWDGQGVMTNSATCQASSAPPAFWLFSATEDSNNVWTFYGHVQNECLGGNKVTFTGLPEFEGNYTTTDSNGDFSMSIQLYDGDAGTVMATVTDCWNFSDTACTTVSV